MELIEFLKEYRPACYAEMERINQLPEWQQLLAWKEWVEKRFPDTLQNLIDRMCQQQRELCVEAYDYLVGYTDKDRVVEKAILSASQPEL